jgi:Transposase DDE domain
VTFARIRLALFGGLCHILPVSFSPAIPVVLPADRRAALQAAAGQGGWIDEHLARLRALPAHGNRTLHIDQLFLGLLMSFFDPLVRSLRLIEGSGNFGGRLDLSRLARSTTADALAVFDPVHLQPLVDDLRARVPHLAHSDADLSVIVRRIIAADGTYLTTLADVAWALHHTKTNGKRQAQVRANVQMDVASWTPQVLSISGDDGISEPAAFAKDLLSGVLYVADRNFMNFEFLKALLAKDNDFVVRAYRHTPLMRVIREQSLTPADVQAGVVADEIIELKRPLAPRGLFRRVTVKTFNRHGEMELIYLLSNLTSADIPARVIAVIYRQRWQIELFFKWLKTWARMDHLLSTSRNGITFQFYVAVIGVLMMCVQSGRRVSIYALAALSRLARGECTVEQAMAVLAQREHERSLNRARQAKRRALKKLG